MSFMAMKIFGLKKTRRKAAKLPPSMQVAIRRALAHESHLLRGNIVKGLRDQTPGGNAILPLSDMTIKMRKLPRKGSKTGRARGGSTKALIDNGDLIGSVTTQKTRPDGMAFTVGVHRGARGRKGSKDMASLAAIHENGTRLYTVRVTRKMHRFSLFLMSQGVLRAPWPVGKELRRRTPARPFLFPAWREWVQESEERFELSVHRTLGQLVVL